MKNDKFGSRKAQAAETKNKIYRIADQMFRKDGIENVSVDSIVKAAGISKGAFYGHFDSKDSLVAALINDYVNTLDTDYKAFIGSFDADTPASDIILALVEKFVDVISCMLGYDNMKVVYKAQITKTINANAVLDYNRYLYKMFNDVIGRGVRQGEFTAAIPVDALTRHFLMAVRGITYEWCIRYPDFDYRGEALKHFEILLAGIKNR